MLGRGELPAGHVPHLRLDQVRGADWTFALPTIVKRSVVRGCGAYRLIPPGGFSGYNAFHVPPSREVVAHIRQLLDSGWKGYLTLWDEEKGKARLLAGHPLQKFEIPAGGDPSP